MPRASTWQARLRRVIAPLFFIGLLGQLMWSHRDTGTTAQIILLATGMLVTLALGVWYICQPNEAPNDERMDQAIRR